MNSQQDTPTVFIVDDDNDVRESLQELLESVGLLSESFGTAQEFLYSRRHDGPSCLILDVRLPGISGLDLQRELKSKLAGNGVISATRGADSVETVQTGSLLFLSGMLPVRDGKLQFVGRLGNSLSARG